MSQLYLFTRFLIGLIFLLSASAKARDTSAFALAIRDYDILPSRLAQAAAFTIIFSEGYVGLCHIVNVLLGGAIQFALTLLLIFGVAVSINIRRGKILPCYCFGGSTDDSTSTLTLARIGLLAFGEVLLLLLRHFGYNVVDSIETQGVAFCWATCALLMVLWVSRMKEIFRLLRRVR